MGDCTYPPRSKTEQFGSTSLLGGLTGPSQPTVNRHTRDWSVYRGIGDSAGQLIRSVEKQTLLILSPAVIICPVWRIASPNNLPWCCCLFAISLLMRDRDRLTEQTAAFPRRSLSCKCVVPVGAVARPNRPGKPANSRCWSLYKTRTSYTATSSNTWTPSKWHVQLQSPSSDESRRDSSCRCCYCYLLCLAVSSKTTKKDKLW